MDHVALKMQAFKVWSMSVYHAGRPVELMQRSAHTFESQRQRVHELLGYLYHHESVERPGLAHDINSEALNRFLAARGIEKPGHLKMSGLRSVMQL